MIFFWSNHIKTTSFVLPCNLSNYIYHVIITLVFMMRSTVILLSNWYNFPFHFELVAWICPTQIKDPSGYCKLNFLRQGQIHCWLVLTFLTSVKWLFRQKGVKWVQYQENHAGSLLLQQCCTQLKFLNFWLFSNSILSYDIIMILKYFLGIIVSLL